MNGLSMLAVAVLIAIAAGSFCIQKTRDWQASERARLESDEIEL